MIFYLYLHMKKTWDLFSIINNVCKLFFSRCVGTLRLFGGKVTNLSPNKARIFSKNALKMHNRA